MHDFAYLKYEWKLILINKIHEIRLSLSLERALVNIALLVEKIPHCNADHVSMVNHIHSLYAVVQFLLI